MIRKGEELYKNYESSIISRKKVQGLQNCEKKRQDLCYL